MSLLEYTSKEMFSSTELVRKSKNIFDKLNRKEIEKAIILRDGKPNTILLDFEEYEKIMTDYLKLKGKDIVEIPSIESEKNETVKSDKNIYTLNGKTRNVSTIYIGNRKIYLDTNGYFKEEILLYPGNNLISIKSFDRFGKEVKKDINIYYNQLLTAK